MTDDDRLQPPTAFPLDWPFGWTRTPTHKRQHSSYQVTFTQARDEMFSELERYRARDIVFSSNIPTTRDGKPIASYREPADPGVALYFRHHSRGELVIPIDHWRSARENIRAVGLALAAMRALERTGAPAVIARMTGSFKRLPPPALSAPWWQVLKFSAPPRCQQDVAGRFRVMSKTHHPDQGGDPELFSQLSAAYHRGMQETPK